MVSSFFVTIICSLCLRASFSNESGTTEKCVPNDNYCDCITDETTTSACSMYSASRFECLNNTYFTQTIPLSQIGDGVCDCCDGSDEVDKTCDHVCLERGAIRIAEAAALQKLLQDGLQKKLEIVSKIKEEFDNITANGNRAKALIDETTATLTRLRDQLNTGEILEKKELEEEIAKQQQEYENKFYNLEGNNLISEHNFFHRKNIINAIASMTLLSGEEAVDAILKYSHDRYESPGDDPDETEALYLCMQNMITKSNKKTEVLEDGTISNTVVDENIHAMVTALALDRLSDSSLKSLYPSAMTRAMNKGVLTASFEYIGFSEEYIPSNVPEYPNIEALRNSYRRVETEMIRKQIIENENNLERYKNDAENAQKIADIDFGPDNILYGLWNKCFRYFDEVYSYVICPYKDAQQGSTLLGVYSGYSIKNNILRMRFKKGHRCLTLPTKPHRKLTLYFKCSENEGITELEESDVCVYKAWLSTPLAC